MKTVKFFHGLIVAVCLFVLGNAQVMATNEEGEIDIPFSLSVPFDGSDARDLNLIPFTAYYQNGTIYISTMGDFTTLAVSVVNETTGQVWNSTTDISDGMGEISIVGGGKGCYTVEIVTEYNECFTGSFVQQD